MSLPVPLDSTNSREHRGQLAAAIRNLQQPPPTFSAYLSAATTNDKTGDGTNYAVVCDLVDINIGSLYGSGGYSADRTGVHEFGAVVLVANLGAAHTLGEISLARSDGVNFISRLGSPGALRDNGNFAGLIFPPRLIPMTAGQTISLKVLVNGSTKTVGVFGSASRYTAFWGGYVRGL